jgi:two-component system response regulator AtoC
MPQQLLEVIARHHPSPKPAKTGMEAEIIAADPAILAVKNRCERVAGTGATVLLTGESGVGKDVFAKQIHQLSDRRSKPYVAINCAAIPENLLESTLFGYEKGAFTGAVKERIGKFELADGGTLFLDEITEMPIQLQAKLLRVLQEGVVEKIGSNKSLTLDVRVIAATNRDPLQAVREGKLREDLYYRLNVFQLKAPSLRERPEDIKRLVHYFLAKSGTQISDTALMQLQSYAWPGNVRELENILERASILAAKQTILPQHLPADILPSAKFVDDLIAAEQPFSIPQMTAQIEKKLIFEVD